MNADAFPTCITRVLAPELGRGEVVVMDNLSSHKALAARAAIETGGATLLFLSSYSPDFNPIEQAYPSCSPTGEKRPSGLFMACRAS